MNNLNKYTVNIDIYADNQEEAQEVIESILRIHENVSNEDLFGMSMVIEEKPEVVNMIKTAIVNPTKFFTSKEARKIIFGFFKKKQPQE